MKERNRILNLVLTAVMAALVLIATNIIHLPSFGPSGYVNLGDAFVLLSVLFLGPLYGGLAGGLGSALADILSGYAVFAPGTFVIKFLMGVAAGLIVKLFKSKDINVFSYGVGAIVGEVIMVFGYFVYEAFVLGYGMAAAAGIISNSFQAVVNVVLFLALTVAVKKSNAKTLITEKIQLK